MKICISAGLLVVTGEFGRTPRISIMQSGRDHWPQAMSALICGGGMRTGQVIGSTAAKGENPKDRPLAPNDQWATVYRHLGIDSNVSFPDDSGRPMPILPFGDTIAELISRCAILGGRSVESTRLSVHSSPK